MPSSGDLESDRHRAVVHWRVILVSSRGMASGGGQVGSETGGGGFLKVRPPDAAVNSQYIREG